jgi:hypothetical protein
MLVTYEGGLPVRTFIRLSLVAALLAFSPRLEAAKVHHRSSSYDIQGICRIEMKRGPDIEGVVLLGRGYDCNCLHYWDSNGFYFIRGDSSSSAILFDRYNRYITSGKIPDDEYWELSGTRRPPPHVVEWPEHEKVYFLYARPNKEFVPTKEYLPPETLTIISSIDSTSQPPLLRRDITEHLPVEYDLLDYIPVYPRIPDEVALRETKSMRPRRIPLRDIKTFRIVMRLSEKWAYEVWAADDRAYRRDASVRWYDASRLDFLRRLYSPWENDPPAEGPEGLRPFDLQAVCRIETTDSQTVTGAILIASDVHPREFEYVPETNGFFFIPDDPRMQGERRWEEIYLFPFSSSLMRRGVTTFWTTVLDCGRRSYQGWPAHGKEYYLKDVTIQKLGKSRFRTAKSEVVREGESLVLKRDVVNRYPNVFEMRDCVPVYPEIPEDGSLREAASVQPVCVPMSKIRDFEILMNPPEVWWTRAAHSQMERPYHVKRGPMPVKWLVGYDDDPSREAWRFLKPADAAGFDVVHRKLTFPDYLGAR